jgi:hypothetical protein
MMDLREGSLRIAVKSKKVYLIRTSGVKSQQAPVVEVSPKQSTTIFDIPKD